MRTSWPSRQPAAPAGTLLTALTIALLLGAANASLAQDTLFTQQQIESIDAQLEDSAVADSIAADTPNEDLWDEYQRYRDKDSVIRTTGERVEIGSPVVVDADERVGGDVVSVGGSVTVHGYVEGDVVAVGGSVYLHDGAEVVGDVVAVGGRVREIGNARVQGEKVSINIPLPLNMNWSWDGPDLHFQKPRFLSMGLDFGFLIIGLLLALLAYAVAGRRLDVTSRRAETEPGQSFLVGLLGAFGTPLAVIIASILLAITIIGLLLIPVLLIVVWVLGFAGFVAVTLAVGRRIMQARADELSPTRSPYVYVIAGFVLVHGFGLLASLLSLGGGFLDSLALLCDVLDCFVLIFASILGFGALLLSRFGTQLSSGGGPAFAPAAPGPGMPPPPPPPPPSAAQAAAPAERLAEPPAPPPPPPTPPPTGPAPPEPGRGPQLDGGTEPPAAGWDERPKD